MNSDVFLRHMKEVTKNMIENTRQINKRDRRRSDYKYEDDLEHDYGYESSYHNLYDTHQLPHPCNKDFPTIPSGSVSRHEPRSQSQSNPYSQVTRAVKKQDRQSPFDFFEISGAPHSMPNNYTRRMPQFNGNKDISIESHLDILWDYMEYRGTNNEDVYTRALGESLRGDVQLWFDYLAP